MSAARKCDRCGAALGSDVKLCYATDYTHGRCKYSVNSGWMEDTKFYIPTLRHGALTAEQVREAIERHFGKVAVLDDGKPVEWRDDWVCKVAIDYRGIADELNAMLGRGECEDEGGIDANGEPVFSCSECGCVLRLYGSDGANTLCTRFVHDYPRFCPACGRRVKR